jgi:hypothetical protein
MPNRVIASRNTQLPEAKLPNIDVGAIKNKREIRKRTIILFSQYVFLYGKRMLRRAVIVKIDPK